MRRSKKIGCNMKKIFISILFFISSILTIYGDPDMNEKTEKLINNRHGWVLDGFNDNGYYSYIVVFSDNNVIGYSYSTNIRGRTTKGTYDTYVIQVSRSGTFSVENNTLTINFHSVIGSRYNRPKFYDKPLLEDLTIIMEIELTDDELIINNIVGVNIFEDHIKDTPIILNIPKIIYD
jgi:hypothetical protein